MLSLSDVLAMKWLLLPLYPFIVLLMFLAWLWVRSHRSANVTVKLKMLGLSLGLSIGPNVTSGRRSDDTLDSADLAEKGLNV